MMKTISPKALRERLDAGEAITVIDVREGWELQRSAVDFATHIPARSRRRDLSSTQSCPGVTGG